MFSLPKYEVNVFGNMGLKFVRYMIVTSMAVLPRALWQEVGFEILNLLSYLM